MVACYILSQFGLACERARTPGLDGSPLALLDDRRVVRVASDEAAILGVRAGLPLSAARTLCPALATLPYDAAHYEAAAHAVWDIFALETSVVEPVSPELCYLDISGTSVPERLERLALEISQRVHIPVQIGIGCSKWVAFHAGMKGDNCTTAVISPGKEADLLRPVSIYAVPGLLSKAAVQLEKLGVRTLGDILTIPQGRLPRQIRAAGHLLAQYANGQDNDQVKALWPPPTEERRMRFDDEVSDRSRIEACLLDLAHQISRALMASRVYCRECRLTVGLADDCYAKLSERLTAATADADTLFRALCRLFERLPIDQPVTSLSAAAGEIGSAAGVQLSLLEVAGGGMDTAFPHERDRAVETAVNFIQEKFGTKALVPAATLLKARQSGTWIYPIGSLLSEPIDVYTSDAGAPVRYRRRLDAYEVRRILQHWRETAWAAGTALDTGKFRVVTDPSGLYELSEQKRQWLLSGVAD